MKDSIYKMIRSLLLALTFYVGMFNASASNYNEAYAALGIRDQEKVLSISEELLASGQTNDHIQAWYFKARAYTLLGSDGKIQYDKAIEFAQKVIHNTTGQHSLHMDAQLLSAQINIQRGHYMEALKSLLLLESKEWVQENPSHRFRVESHLFQLYVEIGDTESASLLFAGIKDLNSNLSNSAKLFNRKNLGYYHLINRAYDKAKHYYNEALNYADNDPSAIVDVRHMLAEIEKEQGNFDAALRIYNNILRYEDSVNYEHGFIHTLLIATETSIMGNKEKVDIARYAFRAYQFARKLQNKLRLTQTQVALGYYYLQSETYDSSLYYLENACELAGEIEAFYWQRSAARIIAQIYDENRMYESSSYYKQVQIDANDALTAANRERMDQLLKNVHLIHAFHQEKEASKQKIKTQRYYLTLWILVSVATFIVALLAFRMYVRQKRHNRFLVEKAIKEAKLKQQVTVTSKPSKSGIDDAVMESLKEKLESFIQDKGYLDVECSLPSLAKQLETNTAYLSHLINDTFEVSFNQFINEYRVADFIAKMKAHPEMKKMYTLEHIASESGFKSKSTFIRAFKKQTGITPSVFMQNLSKNQ